MNDVIKVCKIHGNLTKEEVFFRKPPRNEIVCKKCKNIRGAKYRCIQVAESVTERKCSRCRSIKQKNQFRPYQWKLRSPYCIECRIKNSTNDYHKNRSHLKLRFGITVEQYEFMLSEQNYACKICKNPESALGVKKNGTPKRLSVDHCHKTKKIRGLLCQRCNSGIGQFFENIEHLKSAILYLNENKKENIL